jgi:hypothetical protein
MTPPEPSALRAIDPNGFYPTRAVAALFGVSVVAVSHWYQAGLLRPEPNQNGRMNVRGAAIIALAATGCPPRDHRRVGRPRKADATKGPPAKTKGRRK